MRKTLFVLALISFAAALVAVNVKGQAKQLPRLSPQSAPPAMPKVGMPKVMPKVITTPGTEVLPKHRWVTDPPTVDYVQRFIQQKGGGCVIDFDQAVDAVKGLGTGGETSDCKAFCCPPIVCNPTCAAPDCSCCKE